MNKLLKNCQTAYIQTQNLLPFLTDYTNPRDFIARLVKRGDLVRLKNGFFLIAEKIETTPPPFEQIANLLYGPSYISLEWALSYYGMIPEGVYVVTSVTVNQSKNFPTEIGSFSYKYLNRSRYAVGIDQKENSGGRYLIATPEKALADVVHFKAKKLSKKDLLVDLIEGRRIEEENLKALDRKKMQEIADNYHSQAVDELVNALGLL
jgi:hypothetical protein